MKNLGLPQVPGTVTGRATNTARVRNVRTVYGRDIVPGDVLPTGIVMGVTTSDIDAEVRLEMAGANIHYVGYDEHVLVLVRCDHELTEAIRNSL